MQLIINGESREFADDLNLTALLEQLKMKAERVAVELNCDIVPRAAWAETLLKDGDRLEIVHFVGGGKPSFWPSTLPGALRPGLCADSVLPHELRSGARK